MSSALILFWSILNIYIYMYMYVGYSGRWGHAIPLGDKYVFVTYCAGIDMVTKYTYGYQVYIWLPSIHMVTIDTNVFHRYTYQ